MLCSGHGTYPREVKGLGKGAVEAAVTPSCRLQITLHRRHFYGWLLRASNQPGWYDNGVGSNATMYFGCLYENGSLIALHASRCQWSLLVFLAADAG